MVVAECLWIYLGLPESPKNFIFSSIQFPILGKKIVTYALLLITMACKAFPTPSVYLPKATRSTIPTEFNQKAPVGGITSDIFSC